MIAGRDLFLMLELEKHRVLHVIRHEDTVFEFRQPASIGFGIRFAISKSVKVLEVKVDGEVMEALVGCSTVQYAIIQASSKENHPEKVVIAYPDENCLRDLMAEPSIVGLGFTSREEAMAKLVGRMPDSKASKRKHHPILMSHKAQQGRDAASGFGFVNNHRNAFHILQWAFATVTVLFYSRNLFSAVLRAALGFPS